MKRIRKVLANLMIYVTLIGTIGFTLFILEEGSQVAVFGVFSAKAANDWGLMIEGANVISNINEWLKTINNAIGWVNPLGYLSYRKYAEATDFYIKTITSQAFANNPALFAGKNVDFMFTPNEIRNASDADGYLLINRNIHVFVDEKPPTMKQLQVHGRMTQVGQILQIDMRNAKQPSAS